MSETRPCRTMVIQDGAVLAVHDGLLVEEGEMAQTVARLAEHHPGATILAEMREDELIYAWCRRPGESRLHHSVFYNDFDDYEDDIAIGDDRWLQAVLRGAASS